MLASIPGRSLCRRTASEIAAAKRREKLGRTENQFDLHTEAYRLYGVDVTEIPGIETNCCAPVQ